MSKQESTIDPRSLYERLGLPAQYVAEAIDVLSQVKTNADLDREMTTRRWTADQEQFLLPLFRPLYEHSAKIKSETLDQLEGNGVSRRLAHGYLTAMGNQPHLIFRLDNKGRVPEELGDKFIEKAKQVMLKTLKEQLAPAPRT